MVVPEPGGPQPAGRSPALARLMAAAAEAVHAVRQGRSLAAHLATVAPALRSGTQAIAFDVLRRLGTAGAVRDRLVRRRPDAMLDALLCVALVLLQDDAENQYPEFTVIDQAVEAVRLRPGHAAQAAFVNACLRRFQRERGQVLQSVHASAGLPARWNHPAWWVRRLQHDWPVQWQAILRAAQRPAPLDLRVHAGRMTPLAYCGLLGGPGIAATVLGGSAVRLARSVPVDEIPGHAEGQVSVQSVTAQLAAPLLLAGLGPDAPRILDACAAPGGKTAHLLELAPRARVTALDIDAERVGRIHQNLQRLGLHAQVRVADAGRAADWWDGEPYDAVLLDAPCSASGISGRHPDVRWLRRADDIARLAAQQDRLLQALWPLLAPGGRLLYCTCSAFREEGEQRIARFLATHSGVTRLAAPGYVLPAEAAGRAPDGDNSPGDTDVFFHALLQKD